MKKKSFYFIVLILFAVNTIFAQEEGSKKVQNDKVNVEFIQGFGYNFLQNAKHTDVDVYTQCNVDFKKANLSCGINQCDSRIDLTLRGLYLPFEFNNAKHKLGFNALYHLYVFPDEFFEHDLEAGGYYKYNILPFLQFRTCMSYYVKISTYVTEAPCLINRSLSLDLILDWQINDSFNLFGGTSTNTYFDYPVLFAPTFFANVKYDLNDHLFIGTEVDVKFIDIVTTVLNMNQFSVQVYGGYKL